MPTELEELVGFIASPSPQIRAVAIENLVVYSTTQPTIFKANELLPIKNLKVLIQDRPQIAEHALTILVNLSADGDVLKFLAADDKFLTVVYARIINPSEPNANLLAMLLANLAKWDGLRRILDRKQKAPDALGSDDLVMNQLVDLFVKGPDRSFNKDADFDYLAYLFADLAKHAEVRQYFVKKQSYDDVIPLTKLKVFTEHQSDIRRKGVASTIKNVAFDIPSHPLFFSEEDIHIFPYVLLPIMGGEDYDEDDMLGMLPEMQLLPPDKKRDDDPTIIKTHVETLMLFTTTKAGRDLMREIKVYPVIRETHSHSRDEGVRDACDRLVQVLMLSDEEDEKAADSGARVDERQIEEVEEDDDDRIVEV